MWSSSTWTRWPPGGRRATRSGMTPPHHYLLLDSVNNLVYNEHYTLDTEETAMTALAPTPSATEDFALMEQVLVDGDLTPLTPKQRATYYMRVCQSLGLNPLTKPFEYLVLGTGRQAKLVLYPTRTAT